MNIEDFRTYCLSFKGVSEKMPFGKASTEYDRNLLSTTPGVQRMRQVVLLRERGCI